MKNQLTEFYLNKFYFLKSFNETDVSSLPPVMKRRMSRLDKCVYCLLDKTFDDKTQHIIFSSQYGEAERLLKMLKQYTFESELSPNMFMASVHNFPLGFYLLNKQKSVSYSAESASSESLQMGLLNAVISQYENNVFCYSDVFENNFGGMAINISKKRNSSSTKYVLKVEDNNEKESEYEDFIRLFEGSASKIRTSLYSIERVYE